ncbi:MULTISPECIES: SDR family NAD(P)-dependent oxidoreductase [Actibacterium]|uniref:3-oxoacyl-[acyl-carrier protein] reductase n=1 Tax=Actibacterium naphthalenivorans TaxID=1614693 RepID=A0A840CD56_9RHOB|nr:MULTISPECIES: SDR family oxidoreductase [Actibacterium]ALG91375.1 hypothetical protein TQ29_15750 [Actibacterium sp. EMB200-NS6]MBB4022793.1 3-oxoacyl-[acyl-carrier protein] reductase [Actibacterium naphthalenivorans]
MRTTLVTGAARGIGRAIAERLLEDGHNILASDMLSDALDSLRDTYPDRVEVIRQDITEADAPDAAVTLAMERFGRLDGLVNNAGVGHSRPVHEVDDEMLDRFLAVNVRAQFRFARSALNAFGAGGNIINIASIFGLRSSVGSGPYAMSKAAIVGLTRQLATDYGPRGIRANAVAPGLIETPMTADRIQNDREFRRIMVDTTPFPRVGTPNDIANAVAFLASDQAAFVSGHVLVVDGGWLAGNNPRDTGAENIHVS